MNKIFIVGLGAGDLNQLPLGVYKTLKGNLPVFLRTKEHPVVLELEKEGFIYESFDEIYEKHENFEEVYEEIVSILLQKAKSETIIYAVPGHPIVAERTVQLLLEKKEEAGIELEFVGGQSFLDALFQAVQIDPIEGFQLLDGTSFSKLDINLTQHVIIGQVYDGFIASHVKLELMDLLPDDYPIYKIEAAGSSEEKIKKVPLYLLDHEFEVHNLLSLYIPPVQDEAFLYKNFTKLREIIAILRGPNGCPWDKKQTHESLKKYLIEECYELLEAIDEGDDHHIVEELGDILLHVMLHAQIGEDEGYFSIDDVIESIASKMVRRHPHVFGNVIVHSSEEVVDNWQKIKESEKGKKNQSILKEIQKGLPALLDAYEIQKAASKVGFDWDEADSVFAKILEEVKELKEEIVKANDRKALISEVGDLLFSVVNLSRQLDIHPEEALVMTNQKFKRRFQYIESQIETKDKTFADYTLEELDSLWEEAKKEGL